MTVRADALLAGPRGRRMLLALVTDESVRQVMFRVDVGAPGTWAMVAHDGRHGARFFVDRRRTQRAMKEYRRPATAAELARALAAAPPPTVDALALVGALRLSVDASRPYQDPERLDLVSGESAVVEALRPVAEAVAAHPFAAAWDDAAPGEQVTVDLARTRPNDMAELTPRDPSALLETWLAHEREAAGGGLWWSCPPGELAATTSVWPYGAVGLHLVEDAWGAETAVVTPVDASGAAIVEIRSGEDWAELCRGYPLDVTASREPSWAMSTGRSARWVMPDWAALARDADAVHLTIGAYLAAASTFIDLGDGRASVIAGWSPDATYWLSRRPAPTGPAATWRHTDTTGWREVAEN